MPKDLVAELSRVPLHGTFTLEPGEFRVNLVIDRPLTVQGCGAATHLQGVRGSGPTLHVRCGGVTLCDLGIEHLDAAGYAIAADPGTDPVCINLSVAGGRTVGCTQQIRATPAPSMSARRPRTTSRVTGPPPPGPATPPLPPTSPPTSAPFAPGPSYLPAPLLVPQPGAPGAGSPRHVGLVILGGFAALAIVVVIALAAAGGSTSKRKAAAAAVDGERGRGPLASTPDVPPPPPSASPPAPAPAPAPMPPPPSSVEFVGWDVASGSGVVDTHYVEPDGDAVTVRLVFDPRNGIVERLGGPGPRAIYRVDRSGDINDPGLQSLWAEAHPASEDTTNPRRSSPDLGAPGGVATIAIDVEAKPTEGRMVPAEVEQLSGGFRVTWRRWSAASPPAISFGGSIRGAARNLVTYNAVDRQGRTWDLLQLEGRVPGSTTFAVLYQEVQFHWLGRRVLITVNETTDEPGARSGTYFVRSAGPQIKLLYPPDAPERGDQAAALLDQRLGFVATTLEANTNGVRAGVFYRRSVDRSTRRVTDGDLANPPAAAAVGRLLDLPPPEVQALKWIDLLVVLPP